jgi:hypothetical protein
MPFKVSKRHDKNKGKIENLNQRGVPLKNLL